MSNESLGKEGRGELRSLWMGVEREVRFRLRRKSTSRKDGPQSLAEHGSSK